MQKILAITFTDLRIFLSDRANLVGLLLIPSVLTIVLGLLSTQTLPFIDIAIVDNDQSAQSSQLISDIEAINERYRISSLENGVDDARQRLVDADFDSPTGYHRMDLVQQSRILRSVTLDFYSNEDLTTAPSAIQPARWMTVIGRLNGSIVADKGR